jgi:phosphatidate cytidylyltransferase
MTPELKKRIQTAIVGVTVLVLLLVFGEGPGAALVAAVISMAMLYEFTGIAFALPDQKEKRLAIVGSAWIFQCLNYWIPGGEFGLLSLYFICISAFFLFTAERYNGEELKQHYRELMASIFGFVYLAILPSYLVALRVAPNGKHWVMFFLFIIWANDVGAYFAGLRYGKRRLYAHISPKKSWEGAYGGAAASLVIAVLYKALFFKALSWSGAIFIPLLLSVVSPVGDLAESFLKRAFDKKDSGAILPGHGGVLDRFDGVIFALPVMYVLSRLF